MRKHWKERIICVPHNGSRGSPGNPTLTLPLPLRGRVIVMFFPIEGEEEA